MNEKIKNEIKEKTLKALDENDLENVAGGKELSDNARAGLAAVGAILSAAAIVALALTPIWVDIDRERKEKKERAKREANPETQRAMSQSNNFGVTFVPRQDQGIVGEDPYGCTRYGGEDSSI